MKNTKAACMQVLQYAAYLSCKEQQGIRALHAGSPNLILPSHCLQWGSPAKTPACFNQAQPHTPGLARRAHTTEDAFFSISEIHQGTHACSLHQLSNKTGY
jgi:hypothetical protein